MPMLLAEPGSHHHPVVLLATTLHLDNSVRLAMAFAEMNCRVAVVCPPGHWAKLARCVWRCLPYGALNPQQALQDAIEQVQPDIVIPCDDRAVRHMHMLHASTDNAAVR